MREFIAVIVSLIVPAVLMAEVPIPRAMADKIIRIHGTYLKSPSPMPCGKNPLDSDSYQRILRIFNRVAWWPNFRAMYPGKWEVDVQNCKVPVGEDECKKLLDMKGLNYEPVSGYPAVPNPVLIPEEVNGVAIDFRDPLIVSCDLAIAIEKMTEIFSEMGIERVGVLSAYRPLSEYSFHSLGLAIDINYLDPNWQSTPVWVKTAFEKNEKEQTCNARPQTKRGKFLLDAVCALWKERIFNTVITPNYNEGHANHFHLDLRPGDNRFYLR